MSDYADDWDVAAATSAVVFQALASRTGMTVEEVEAHTRECCRQIGFHPSTWRYARERRRPQALVTVNPDPFRGLHRPSARLHGSFDVIVVPATENCSDKAELCELALDRLGFVGDRSEALLIDNRAELVSAWKATGGTGYWFRGDDDFGRDFAALLGDVR